MARGYFKFSLGLLSIDLKVYDFGPWMGLVVGTMLSAVLRANGGPPLLAMGHAIVIVQMNLLSMICRLTLGFRVSGFYPQNCLPRWLRGIAIVVLSCMPMNKPTIATIVEKSD